MYADFFSSLNDRSEEFSDTVQKEYCESWLRSSFLVVSGLIEVHCYDGSLAVCGSHGGCCCSEMTEVHLFFLQLRSVCANKQTDLQSI